MKKGQREQRRAIIRGIVKKTQAVFSDYSVDRDIIIEFFEKVLTQNYDFLDFSPPEGKQKIRLMIFTKDHVFYVELWMGYSSSNRPPVEVRKKGDEWQAKIKRSWPQIEIRVNMRYFNIDLRSFGDWANLIDFP